MVSHLILSLGANNNSLIYARLCFIEDARVTRMNSLLTPSVLLRATWGISNPILTTAGVPVDVCKCVDDDAVSRKGLPGHVQGLTSVRTLCARSRHPVSNVAPPLSHQCSLWRESAARRVKSTGDVPLQTPACRPVCACPPSDCSSVVRSWL
jgi:hypothetical protein